MWQHVCTDTCYGGHNIAVTTIRSKLPDLENQQAQSLHFLNVEWIYALFFNV